MLSSSPVLGQIVVIDLELREDRHGLRPGAFGEAGMRGLLHQTVPLESDLAGDGECHERLVEVAPRLAVPIREQPRPRDETEPGLVDVELQAKRADCRDVRQFCPCRLQGCDGRRGWVGAAIHSPSAISVRHLFDAGKIC